MTAPLKQSDRAFGLTFAAIFAIVAVAFYVFAGRIPAWAIWLSAIFLALALLSPGILMPLNRLWASFAFRLSHVSNFLLLGLFFYIFIVPAGAIMRLLGRDPMTRRIDKTSDTYLSPVTRQANRQTFADLF